jgi:hypothetical protein
MEFHLMISSRQAITAVVRNSNSLAVDFFREGHERLTGELSARDEVGVNLAEKRCLRRHTAGFSSASFRNAKS